MGKRLTTYFDFAESDFQYLVEDYRNGRVANYMGALSQNTCERYLKYMIEEKYQPQDSVEAKEKSDVLRTHNLGLLIKFLKRNQLCEFSKEETVVITAVNGFYYTTRYPGDDSISVDQEDMDNCMTALTICRDKALTLNMELTSNSDTAEKSTIFNK